MEQGSGPEDPEERNVVAKSLLWLLVIGVVVMLVVFALGQGLLHYLFAG